MPRRIVVRTNPSIPYVYWKAQMIADLLSSGEAEVVEVQALEGTEVCDFCSVRKPEYENLVYPFCLLRNKYSSVPGGFQNMDEWLACETCQQFIHENNHAALFRESFAASLGRAGHDMTKIDRRLIVDLHAAFWACRTGEIVILGKEVQ